MKKETRQWLLGLVDEALAYGAKLGKICEMIGKSSRTIKRWRKCPRDDGRKENRFSTSNALTDEERDCVVETSCSDRFKDMKPEDIVATLAGEGEYIASENTFRRILKKMGLLKHRSDTKAPQREKPKELVATGPNQVWSWDITYCLTGIPGIYFFQYFIIDIWDRSIVGWAVHAVQSGQLASELIRETCERHGVIRGRLTIHQDNGSPMISEAFLAALEQCGIAPSYSRAGVCDDNPYSESLFKTEKYRPGYPLRFASLEELREWTEKFVHWYNNVHLHSGIGFVTPMQRRNGEDVSILETRRRTYEAARLAHPERWSRNTRKWDRPESVVLNPKRSKKEAKKAS